MLNYFSKMVLRLECVQILDIFRFLGKVNRVHKVILFLFVLLPLWLF